MCHMAVIRPANAPVADGDAFAVVVVVFDDHEDDLQVVVVVVSGLALNGTSYYGKLRTVKNGGSWL